MKILTIADVDDFKYQEAHQSVDLIISLGDVVDQYILSSAEKNNCSHIFAVKGNHDSNTDFPELIIDLHLKTQSFMGFTFGGFRRRRKGPDGRTRRASVYTGRYQLEGDPKLTEISLHTKDKQVAEAALQRIVDEKQREAVGILAPKGLRDGARMSLSDHLTVYLADLVARERSPKHVRMTRTRINAVIDGCRWVKMADVTAASFEKWRSKQNMAPKTLNDYLATASSFLSWLEQRGLVAQNPLKLVGKVETRGKEKYKRRALTFDEQRRLLDVAGERRPLYLAALHTGLRRNELESLEWGDVHLDEKQPYIEARASTTKNKERALIPLHPDVADALRALKPEGVSSGVAVFGRIFANMYQCREVKKDLKKAGIPLVDDQGRKVDFHSLRHTLATNLARENIPPRIAMEIMRHSDMKLTSKVYTDAEQLPTAAAIKTLPSLLSDGPQIGTHDGDIACSDMAQTDADDEDDTAGEEPVNKGSCLVLAPTGTDGHSVRMAANLQVGTNLFHQ